MSRHRIFHWAVSVVLLLGLAAPGLGSACAIADGCPMMAAQSPAACHAAEVLSADCCPEGEGAAAFTSNGAAEAGKLAAGPLRWRRSTLAEGAGQHLLSSAVPVADAGVGLYTLHSSFLI